jgi:adenylate kinase
LLHRGKGSGRVDDQDLSVIENRIAVYARETEVVMNYYIKQGKFKSIYGKGSIDDIFKKLCEAIENK